MRSSEHLCPIDFKQIKLVVVVHFLASVSMTSGFGALSLCVHHEHTLELLLAMFLEPINVRKIWVNQPSFGVYVTVCEVHAPEVHANNGMFACIIPDL